MEKPIGQRIKSARLAAKLSQRELALLLGVKTETSISNIERGIQDVTITQIEILARVLRVDRSWLAFGTNDSNPSHLDKYSTITTSRDVKSI